MIRSMRSVSRRLNELAFRSSVRFVPSVVKFPTRDLHRMADRAVASSACYRSACSAISDKIALKTFKSGGLST